MPGSTINAPSLARVARIALLAGVLLCCASAGAWAGAPRRELSYHGYRVWVPRGWPVYNLARHPGTCVRFNRHAVYLGRPGTEQRCPAHAAGHTEAILLEPVTAGAASAGAGGSSYPSFSSSAERAGTSSGSLLDRAHGLLITATWRGQPALITRALGLGSLRRLTAARAGAHPTGPVRQASSPAARTASAAPATPGGIYTGLGFDACSAPSPSQMSAWSSSSYDAVGIYIGGTNMACAQPNLSAAWVSRESGAGWHLIPIYVGLQAPTNSCGCAGISPSKASSQGRAAALDAVAKAQALGMGPGNPIYDDMEGYARGSRNSPAVMSFLAAWTSQLHARGYESGVYSSEDSGIYDLVSRVGTGYMEPDELWIANWNGVKSTSDPGVPAGDWANHQRLHQYQGGHNETHGGVRLNIDGDYLDASTAAAGSAASAAADPSASFPPTISGQPLQGDTLTAFHGSWSNGPTSYSEQWEDCNATGGRCIPIPGATAQTYTLGASDIGHTIRVSEMASNAEGTGGPAFSKPTGQVLSLTPLYWLYTARGKVSSSLGTQWYGSPYARGVRDSSVTGMTATADGQGYWLVDTRGRVFAFGDAARLTVAVHSNRVRGIVAAPGGGYWLYTTRGNVYATPGTQWYGSPHSRGVRDSSVTGMATTADGKGYWLVDARGRVFAYGDTFNYGPPRHSHPIVGIAGG